METENFIYKNKKDFTGTLEERDQLLQQSLDRLKIKKAVKSIEHRTLFDYIGNTLYRKTAYRKPYTVNIVNAEEVYIGSLVTFEDDSKKFYFWTYWGASYGTFTGRETKPEGYSYSLADSAGEKHLKEVLTCWTRDKILNRDYSIVAGKDYNDFEGDDFWKTSDKLEEYFKNR